MNYIGANLTTITSINELLAEIAELKKQIIAGGALTEDLTVTVSVGGIPAGAVFSKGTSFEAIFRALLAPEHPMLDTPSISISASTVYWQAIPDATSYRLYIDGQLYDMSIEDTLIDLSSIIYASGTYDIQISAYAEGFLESELSNKVIYTISSTDLYYGQVQVGTIESFKELPGWYMLERTSSGSSSLKRISWSPEDENTVMFIVVRDGIIPTGGLLSSGGLSTVFTSANILGVSAENAWNCSGPENGHEDLIIEGITYHVYGIRSTTWNTTDVLTVNF